MEYHKRTANAQFMKSCVGCQLHYTLNLVNELTWWIVTANGVQGGYLWLSCKQVSGEEKEKSFEGSEPMSAKLNNLEIKAIKVDREPVDFVFHVVSSLSLANNLFQICQ